MSRCLFRFRRSALAALGLWAVSAAAQAEDPVYNGSGELIRPTDYREWIYLTSGLDMFYGPQESAPAGPRMFDNVFVTRAAYAEFMRSGTWPDKTMFVLELRRAESGGSINNAGSTQGAVIALEAAVKDLERFSDLPGTNGWGYFSFSSRQGLLDTAAPLPTSAPCYACHDQNTAVDNTFVQFYPTLFEVAQRFGTIDPDYDPSR